MITGAGVEGAGNLGNVLITGGASGLGAATAKAVSDAGGTPLILDIQPCPATEFSACVDVSDSAATQRAVDDLVERAGGTLDAVFTAAGVDACGDIAEVSAEAWDRVIRVNLIGTASTVRAALPHLVRSRGRVVTCASTLGFRALPAATAYCASKFGIVGFTRALAAETAGRVGVTMLVPGGMETNFFDGRPEQFRPPAEAHLNDPLDVARTVVFAMQQPPGCEIRELVVCTSTESSWP